MLPRAAALTGCIAVPHAYRCRDALYCRTATVSSTTRCPACLLTQVNALRLWRGASLLPHWSGWVYMLQGEASRHQAAMPGAAGSLQRGLGPPLQVPQR